MAKNIISHLRSLRNLLKLLGFLDFDIKYSQIQEKGKGYYMAIYAVIDIILELIYITYGFIANPYTIDFAKTTFSMYLGLAAMKCLAFNFRRLTTRESISNIWEELQLMDSKLTLLGVRSNISGIKVIASTIMISFVGLRILQFTTFKSFDDKTFVPNVAMFIFFRVQDIPSIAIAIEYLVYLLILRQYFDKCSEFYEISHNNHDIDRTICFQKKYIEICDLTSRVVSTVAVPVVAITCDAFFLLASRLQGVVSRLYHSANTTDSFYDARYSTLWCFASCLQFSSFFLTSYLCFRSANKMKDTLRRLSPENPVFVENMKLFSLQILHEDFKIAPSGLFTIDLNLVYVIFATLTSYIVILTQFDLMYFR